ncbi:MAG: sulfite exporter TauE/SafE family protein [Gemmataceae bacterium]
MPDVGFLLLLFVAAVLYTSVGHAGASGYLAVMTFYGLSQDVMRPSALVLNIVAAIPTTVQFARSGHFDKRLFIPLSIGSIPFAAVGGYLKLPLSAFKLFLALALIAAAVRLIWPGKSSSTGTAFVARTCPFWLGLLIGGLLGLLAGLTSIGGGVYLTPILLFAGWADPKKAAGVSSAFILVNSISGLCGQFVTSPDLMSHVPRDLMLWCIVVAVGGLIGSTSGSRRFGSTTLRRILAFVLLLAVIKLIAANPIVTTDASSTREMK